MRTVTSAEMPGIDRKERDEYGIPQARLMEKAGDAVFNVIPTKFPES